MHLYVKLSHPNAKLPTYGSVSAGGIDLYSCDNYIVKANSRECINTGISIEWANNVNIDNNEITNNEITNNETKPENYYLRIAPRSGLALKNGIDVMAGVIDYDYRGEIKVILLNTSDSDFMIAPGDKIAQAILTQINRFDQIIECTQLSDTIRGMGGFGSTGTR